MIENRYSQTPFDLEGRVCVITGALGLLGNEHCLALASAGARIVMVDLLDSPPAGIATSLLERIGERAHYFACDISIDDQVRDLRERIVGELGKVDVLINNAANNPTMSGGQIDDLNRMETYPVTQWNKDLAVGLTGAMLCAREFGAVMAKNGGGVIVNVASDLGLIAPDQRIYESEGLQRQLQPRKPVSYSVTKAGLIGLTKYMSTYWAEEGVRCNALAPGGVFTEQDPGFVSRLTNLVPLGRMADPNEYRGTVLYLCSDASKYMNGAVVVVDGGRTAW